MYDSDNLPASFFQTSGTLRHLHIHASRCINIQCHTPVFRVFADGGDSAAIYASLARMTPTALLPVRYASLAASPRLSRLTEEPVWRRRKGFSAP